jgi:hypothetical protein
LISVPTVGRVDHRLVRSKDELKQALQSIQGSPSHWVVEVVTSISDNVDFHRFPQHRSCIPGHLEDELLYFIT